MCPGVMTEFRATDWVPAVLPPGRFAAIRQFADLAVHNEDEGTENSVYFDFVHADLLSHACDRVAPLSMGKTRPRSRHMHTTRSAHTPLRTSVALGRTMSQALAAEVCLTFYSAFVL